MTYSLREINTITGELSDGVIENEEYPLDSIQIKMSDFVEQYEVKDWNSEWDAIEAKNEKKAVFKFPNVTSVKVAVERIKEYIPEIKVKIEYAGQIEDLNFDVAVKLEGKTLAEASFKGAGAKPKDTNVPLSKLLQDGLQSGKELDMEFTKDGVGTLFYTVSMKYPIPAEEQYARDEGISVFVDYIDVKTGQIVTDNQLKAGSIYKAKVTISTTKDRTFVATRIPIPSGAEVLNAAFATTEQYPSTYSEEEVESEFFDIDSFYSEYNYGLSSQEIYDNEVRYFWDFFRRGKQQVEFMFRAVRNGEFSVPSATAECMYEPEIFGRSKGGVFVISD